MIIICTNISTVNNCNETYIVLNNNIFFLLINLLSLINKLLLLNVNYKS